MGCFVVLGKFNRFDYAEFVINVSVIVAVTENFFVVANVVGKVVYWNFSFD